MNNKKFKVYFDSGCTYEIVLAFNEKEAEILAQAERIKQGKSYTVSYFERIDE